jgi:hypothetical protein
MRGKKETTAPIPSAVTGGEQSSMHKCSLSIAEKKAESKCRGIGNHGVTKYLSGALASIGVVTPQLQICKIWQGLRPLYPALTGGGADA